MRFVYFALWLLLISPLIHGQGQDFIKCFKEQAATNISMDCYNGRCEEGECVCNSGWSGSTCNVCTGRILLEKDSGTIFEANGEYSKNRECAWVIKPKRKGSYKIRLRLEEFQTECGWDYLYIFDGDTAFSPLLGSFNGIISTDKNGSTYRPEVVASSGKAFLHFFSDMEYVLDGFRITYSVNGCPQNCSGKGSCNYENATCSCEDGWTGEACDVPLCDRYCLSSQGSCYSSDDDSVNDCVCAQDATCVAKSNSSVGYWKHLNYLNSSAVHGRASHAGVIVNDSMWFYGGIQFDDPPFSSDFEVYNLKSRLWNHISGNSTSPSLRYGHSMVIHDNIIYIFGGRNVMTSHTLDELWSYDTRALLWEQIDYNVISGALLPSNSSVLALWGHTANAVKLKDGRDVMVVMFGFHPEYELSNFVFEYEFATTTWTKVVTTGDRVAGAYGHTSTWDPVSRLCYIHGGFSYKGSKRKHAIVDVTFSYQPGIKVFKLLRPSKVPRFLHSSAWVNGILMVYGGCTHVENDASKGALCFSPSFMAYYPSEDRWETLTESQGVDSGKYGHVALSYAAHASGESSRMLVFGGYNSETISDAILFEAYSCDAYSASKELCHGNPLGLACVWDGNSCKNSTTKDKENNSCGAIPNCLSCKASELQCSWCDGKCKERSDCSKDEACLESTKAYCAGFSRSCQQCEYNSECQWQQNNCVERQNNITASCKDPCAMHTTCDSCFQDSCMWCTNKKLCFSTMSYVVQFPYGECMEWINKKDECPGKTMCDHHKTCSDCMSDPYCGWCDGSQNNGLGECLMGSLSGIGVPDTSENILSYGIGQSNNETCEPSNWYFSTCPICQCNGHSTCYNGTSECISCKNNTTGNQCERCMPGYYGQAKNGGECKPCECFGRAEHCDHLSGRCLCSTKGMIGDHCEKCDAGNKYVGDPSKNGTCYYRLLMNFSFTFTLTSQLDRYVTAINFQNARGDHTPTQFNFEAQEPCNVRVSYVATKLIPVDNGNGTLVGSSEEEETDIASFTATKSIVSYSLGIPEGNETFRIYVSNFTVPERIVISLVQKDNELLVLLLIIFSCFLLFLLVTAALWKLKLFCDGYRRRRERSEQLQQMATRPFGSVHLLFGDEQNNKAGNGLGLGIIEEVHVASAEMTETGKYVVSTVALQFPSRTEGDTTTQYQAGTLALGSCLLLNRKPPEISKAPEAKTQQKKLKVLFKKGSRFRNSGRSTPNNGLSTQNNCSTTQRSVSYAPSNRESNRTEGSVPANASSKTPHDGVASRSSHHNAVATDPNASEFSSI